MGKYGRSIDVDMTSNKREHFVWVDGLKYIACFGILVSHFCSAFVEIDKNSFAAGQLSPVIDIIMNIFSMFLNGAFQVRLFCVIAGFLATQKVVNSERELIGSIIKRYLRFAIPFFSAGMILLIIEYTIGYHAVECGELLEAFWLGGHNITPVTFSDVLRMAFLFDHSIDAPLWTMRPIFLGTCLVYCIGSILQKLRVRKIAWGGVLPLNLSCIHNQV